MLAIVSEYRGENGMLNPESRHASDPSISPDYLLHSILFETKVSVPLKTADGSENKVSGIVRLVERCDHEGRKLKIKIATDSGLLEGVVGVNRPVASFDPNKLSGQRMTFSNEPFSWFNLAASFINAQPICGELQMKRFDNKTGPVTVAGIVTKLERNENSTELMVEMGENLKGTVALKF